MPPQGLNLNEYGIESGVTAPQARKFAFLGHKSAKISFLVIRYYLPSAWRDFRLAVFLWGGGANYMLAPLIGFWGAWPDWPAPGSASGYRIIQDHCEANKKIKQMP